MLLREHTPGMGSAQVDQQIASWGVSAAGAVGTAVAGSTGALAGAAGALGLSTGVLTAGIGAAIAGVTILISSLIANSGCGVTCITATQYANQAEALFKQNLAAWNSEPHTAANQAQAIANYNTLYNRFLQLCEDPSLGNAGQRCASEREPGGKYAYAPYYLDPIQNATDIIPDASLSSGVESAVSTVTGNPIFLIAAAALAAYFLID